MPLAHIIPSRIVRRIVVVALASAALALASYGHSPAHAAYGPPPPPVPPPPGGYRNIVASETVGPDGGILGPFDVDGLLVTLIVPRHDFAVPVQITITAPDASAIGNGGFRRYLALGGVGVLIQENDSTYPGPFRKGITLDISSPSISAADLVVVWDGQRFVVVRASERSHTEALRFYSESEQDFAVLRPAGNHRFDAADAIRAAPMGADSVARVTDSALTAMFFQSGDSPAPGLGVLAIGG